MKKKNKSFNYTEVFVMILLTLSALAVYLQNGVINNLKSDSDYWYKMYNYTQVESQKSWNNCYAYLNTCTVANKNLYAIVKEVRANCTILRIDESRWSR
jgi:hypothetical protein